MAVVARVVMVPQPQPIQTLVGRVVAVAMVTTISASSMWLPVVMGGNQVEVEAVVAALPTGRTRVLVVLVVLAA